MTTPNIAAQPVKKARQPKKTILSNRFTDFLNKDGRHSQIFYLLIFLSYGLFFLDWEADLWMFAITMVSCLCIQAVGLLAVGKDYSGLKSAFISSLSLCLMFKANLPYTFVLAAALTIASKFLIRFKGKHIFNPTNFGILMTILLTGDAWVSPGQWGSGILFLFMIGITGFFVLFRVGRIDTSLAFLFTFAGLQFVRNVLYLGWGMDFFFHQLSSGTLLLFSFFMITDPVTTPNSPKARIIWAMAVGLLAFFLTNWFYVHTAPLWALLIISPFTVALDLIFKHKQFSWKDKSAPTTTASTTTNQFVTQ